MGTISTNQVIKSLAHVTQHADREQLDINLAETLYHLLDVDKVLLYHLFKNKGQLECHCSIELSDGQTKINNAGVSFQPVPTKEIPGFERCLQEKISVSSRSEDGGYTSLFPIQDKHNHIISVFRLEQSENAEPIENEFISLYFQIYRNYLNLLIDSERDTLTGLLNRKTFDRDLTKIFIEKRKLSNNHERPQRRSESNKNTHWLAITDIDFFKRVNDDFGHLYGDEVLLLLANIMRETFRGVDILFRFGGEEFVIILRSTDLEGTHNALERFRTAVEAFKFPKVGKVTVSIGYVEITEQSIPTEILGFADEALYFSKDNGRNQLNQYEQLIESGKIAKQETPENDIELF